MQLYTHVLRAFCSSQTLRRSEGLLVGYVHAYGWRCIYYCRGFAAYDCVGCSCSCNYVITSASCDHRGRQLQDVDFGTSVLRGVQTRSPLRAVAAARAGASGSGSQPTAVYAEPQMRVWQWPRGLPQATLTRPQNETAAFLDESVATVAAGLLRAQQVCLSMHVSK